MDNIQIILVEPDKQRLGWGVAKLVGSLQDLEVSNLVSYFNFDLCKYKKLKVF